MAISKKGVIFFVIDDDKFTGERCWNFFENKLIPFVNEFCIIVMDKENIYKTQEIRECFVIVSEGVE